MKPKYSPLTQICGERDGHGNPLIFVLEPDESDYAKTIRHDITPDLSRAHVHDYAIEFEWGYIGLQSRQLAAAILLEMANDITSALRHHEDFLQEVVLHLPDDSWRLSQNYVREWSFRQDFAYIANLRKDLGIEAKEGTKLRPLDPRVFK